MSIEKLPCLFESNCSGSKPFRTGTPFCGYHLRTVFGVDGEFSANRVLDKNIIENVGPMLVTAPETCHKQNTIVFPQRHIIDNICNSSVVHEFQVNSTLVKFINHVSCDNRM